jgi:hypothetical protein
MTEEIQGTKGPHGLKASVNPLEQPEREAQEPEDLGIFGSPGAAPALEHEPAE